jgi:hypothetical protein
VSDLAGDRDCAGNLQESLSIDEVGLLEELFRLDFSNLIQWTRRLGVSRRRFLSTANKLPSISSAAVELASALTVR